MEEQLNRRKKYSREVIRKAYIDLLGERPRGRITVKDICDRADVNRTTFYSNYCDIPDLHSRIQDELFERFLDKINSMGEEQTQLRDGMKEILQIIVENIGLCKSLLLDPDSFDYIKKIVYLPCARINNQRVGDGGKKFGFIFEFLVCGFIGLLRKWITEDMNITIDDVSLMVERLNAAAMTLL